MTTWAVITGDIVNSSAMSSAELDVVFDALARTADEIGRWQGSAAPFARYRGDGWQLAMQPKFAFRALIALRAAVRAQGKGFDSRLALGLGEGSLGSSGLADAEGDAFTASGHALDEMRRGKRLSAQNAGEALRAALPLADEIVGGWTAKQAEIVYALIAPDAPTQADVARERGIRRQAVQKQADAAGLEAFLETCSILEDQ